MEKRRLRAVLRHVTHRPARPSLSISQIGLPRLSSVFPVPRRMSHGAAMASEPSKDLPVRPAAEPQGQSAAAPPNEKPAASGNDSLPDFIVERNNLFEELWQKHLEEVKNMPRSDISVTLDLGNGSPSPVAAKAWETTPALLLKDVPKDLSANAVVAKVDGKEYWDLSRPLERDCTLSYVLFDTPEGREVFWHSSAHCLGEACECEYGCLLSHGPPTPQGFFYDMAMPGGYVLLTILLFDADRKQSCGQGNRLVVA